jgi:Domain of unknown function (DUF4386)
MKQLHGVSPRLEARVAGVLYLSSILLGVAATTFNTRNMQALSGPTTVAAGVFYTGLTILLSTSAAIFSLAGCWLPRSWYQAAHTSNFVFFGIYCLLIGYLILRSQFLPNAVGVLMACAGVGWLITTWSSLAHATSPFPAIVGFVGEGTLMVYLLVKGLDERRWREQAGVALTPLPQ